MLFCSLCTSCLVAFIILNRVLLFLLILDMDVLPRHGDHESSHDTSVVTPHVDHVSQLSSLGQNVVNLLFFSFWRYERRLFLTCLSEHRFEGGVIL